MRRYITRQLVQSREEELIAKFSTFVNCYDQHSPFKAHGQLSCHRATISRRRALGSVRSAVQDREFVEALWKTLEAWGMTIRAAELLPVTEFSANLKAGLPLLEGLEAHHIDDTILGYEKKAECIWDAISKIRVAKAKNPIVSGTKTLHHILPDLVPPMDRNYTRVFFHWYSPQFQCEAHKVFMDMYTRISRIALKTNPVQYVGDGWRTSKTKVIDNAIVAYCVKKKIKLD